METTIETKIQTMPRIGDKAPAFKAVTTQGDIAFPDQYAGHWVILFSHPADFTPVCTSEFMTFASHDWFFCTKRIDKATVMGAIVKGAKQG
jgi:peroxiredoxin 2/4